MDHEWLFWDGQEFMKQRGLAKQHPTRRADVARGHVGACVPRKSTGEDKAPWV